MARSDAPGLSPDPVPGSHSRRRRHAPRGARRAVWIVVAIALLIAGAGAYYLYRHQLSDPTALLQRATSAFDSGNYAAAVIDLKNLLKDHADERDARYLLGRTYLKSGDIPSAVKELTKARELGVANPELDRALVRALILTGKFDNAATELAIHSNDRHPDWTVLRGMLKLAQQHIDEARPIFQGVLAEHPEHAEARRGLMQVELATGDAVAARKELEQLLAATTDDAGLWVIKGQLDLHDGDAAAAKDAFQRALAVAPKNPVAVLGMADSEIESGAVDAAANRLDALGAAADEDPRVNFLRARIAEKRGDSNTALLKLNKVLHVAPNHRESLVMAARINFTLGQYSRAQEFSEGLLQLEPDNEGAKRMLGAIQLASGRLDGLSQFGAAASDNPAQIKDPGTLALLGTAYLKHGDYKDAEASLKRAAELAPDSLPIRTQLALGKLSGGHGDEAIHDLEEVIKTQPQFVQAHVMLAMAYLSQHKNDEAMAAARALVAIKPDDALAHNVLGYVLEAGGGSADPARGEYETAVAKDAAFHPARINLARLALKAGDREGAKKHYQDVLARDEYNAFALLGLAAMALAQNNLDEAEKLWQRAREHNPEAVAPRLLLARNYRAQGKQIMAAEVIKEAYKLAPFVPQVQAEYANVMLDSGELPLALAAARALVERAPQAVGGLELLARVYNQLGDEAGLTATLQRVAKIAPDEVNTHLLLGRLALRRKDYTEAKRIVDLLAGRPADVAASRELQGDMELARDNKKAALAAYAQAFESKPDATNLIKLDRLERDLGQAQGRLASWLKQHPDDVQVRLVQASYLQQQGASVDAIAEYESMLKVQGKNPVVLNNLAWLYFERKDARALDLARQAHELAPRQPEIMDTYGWILNAQGQREQGLEVLNKAADIAPDNPDIAYHVASALADSGQVRQAQEQLQKILGTHKQFSLRKDAEALAATLQAKK